MNKIITIAVFALGVSLHGIAQEKKPSEGKVGTAINKAGNKTAQVAVSGTAAITDKKYKGKVGPQGQTIYINKNSHYYYVNGRGKKVYVSKFKLKDKS